MTDPEPLIITEEQLADIAELKAGGDPGQVILPPDWVAPEPDEPDAAA